MKKIIKLFFTFIFCFIIFSIGNTSKANTIYKISMDIYVDSNGNAEVTEQWNCKTDEGTEVYHPYYNLGNSEIKDLFVTDNGQEYETLSSWNTSGTLDSKLYKCGINEISDGVELCWGMNSYGTHIYIAKYTITNFVAQLEDSQMIYWTLIPYDFSTEIQDVYIKIRTDFDISDSVGVWGYGNYGGTAYVYDGYIEMGSEGLLESDEYMTILVQFPDGTFNTTNILENDFDYYLEMAEEGAMAYEEDNSDTIFAIMCLIIALGLMLFAAIAIIKSEVTSTVKVNKISNKNLEYFRDIPCNKDIFRSYYISSIYKIFKNKTDILGAIILKWVKEGLITMEQREGGKVFNKGKTVIILKNATEDQFTQTQEKLLFKMLYEASKDGILEAKEFETWCNKKYSRILDWFDNVLKEQKKLLEKEKLIIKQKTFWGKRYVATQELEEEAKEIAGLKKYLLEYTLIKDREPIEVHLFEEYLVYAQMLGIAKKVAKDFKELYPEIITESTYNSYDNFIFIYTCTSHGVSRAQNARASAYSSGGGGFSSGGGGGGSFGGGGGGGGFR